MVDASGKVDLGRLEGIVCGEVDGEEEDTSGVRRIALLKICQSLGIQGSLSSCPLPQGRHASRGTLAVISA